MSVEGVNVTIDDEKDRKSGFCTCRWALGFTLSLVAGILHVGKSIIMFVILETYY